MAFGAKLCIAKTKNGAPCGRKAQPRSQYCYVHDPNTKPERDRRKAANRAKPKPPRKPKNTSPHVLPVQGRPSPDQTGTAAAATSTPSSTSGRPQPPAPPKPSATGVVPSQLQGSAGRPTVQSGGAAGIASAMAGVNKPVGEAQPIDPETERQLEASLKAKPSWTNDGKVFRIWRPSNPKKVVELPVMEKPGPHTPKGVPPILGKPDQLFAVAFAISKGEYSLLEGPKATAKTSTYAWLAQELNYNLIQMPISRGTSADDMVGSIRPIPSENGSKWVYMYGTVAVAVIASAPDRGDWPTILVFEEINRIGSQQEFAGIYPLLDDSKILATDNRDEKGNAEVLRPGKLFIGATMNPVDSATGNYIGTGELDDAFLSRFRFKPVITHPDPEVEAEALHRRVPSCSFDRCRAMVAVATEVRTTEDIRFELSFRELIAWAIALEAYEWAEAAEIAWVTKAQPDDQEGLRGLIRLDPVASSSTVMGGGA